MAGALQLAPFFGGTVALAADNPVNVVLFGSMEAGPSSFLSSGAKIAIDDVDRDGFVALVSFGRGQRRERGGSVAGNTAPTFVRTTVLGATLGGYQLFYDWGVIGLFAGPEATVDLLGSGADAAGATLRFGLRLQGEIWARPSETTLATATLVLGSARWDAYGRVSAGYRAFGAYLGPELSGYADRTGYAKVGFGLHATDFAFGPVSFRASAGVLYEPETERIGPYFAVSAWAPL